MPSVILFPLAIALGIFIVGLLVLRRSGVTSQARETAKARLKSAVSDTKRKADLSIVRKENREDWLQRLVVNLSPAGSLERALYQAKLNIPVTVFVLTVLLFGVAGFLLAQAFSGLVFAAPLGAALGLMIPLYLLKKRRNSRMVKFQRQLPEALDLVARALKAGHGFNTGLRMVADEYDDPIGPEFQKTLEEINIGLPQDVALYNLTCRVDCPDLKFFVVSVNIQRETGGNLSEIITNMASLVRERFKLHGRIQVLSAEGRLSAKILLALPFLAALALHALNPQYLDPLFTHPVGHIMLGVAATMMLLGIFVIKSMVEIRV